MENWSQPTELNTDLLANIHRTSPDAFTYLYNWGLPVQVTGWSLGNGDAQLPCFWSVAGLATAWETGNSGIADFLTVRAQKDGVEIRLNSKALELVTDDGAVIGVKVEDEEKIYIVNAKAVILASGGFTRNADLIKEYAPGYEEAFAFTGGGSTGDGITMTKDLGVQIVGEGMMGLFGLNPGLGYYGEFGNLVWQTPVTVNAEGETFGMEGTFYGKTLKLLLDQTGACGYGIVDSATPVLERFEKAAEKGYVNKYDTLDELAEGEGIDAENLKQSAEDVSVLTAPFFCIVKKPLFIGSIPGLKVSADCEVLGYDDAPIANLFAAGELIFGNAFSQAYPCSGTGVATSCYTGAVAAKKAAANL